MKLSLKITSVEKNTAYLILNPGTIYAGFGKMNWDKVLKEGFAKEWLDKIVIWDGIKFSLAI